MVESDSLARRFGDFASSATPSDAGVVAAVSDALANAIALMVQACEHPAAVRARRAFRPHFTGITPASVIGMPRRVPAPLAVLSNGISAHVEDFDDTCLPSILHPSAVVIPAAIAAAELTGATGRQLLDATAVGMEVAIRAADGLHPRALDRGWHITGIIGPLGAAAAAGRIIGLEGPSMASALSIAAAQGSGIQAALGSMTKSLHPGRSTLNGLEAAYLASGGVSVPADLLAGPGGLGQTTADHFDVEAATAGLGSMWRTPTNLVKPYACGVVSHPAIAAARGARARLAPDQRATIARAHVRVHPLVLAVMGKKEPLTSLQSKFSVYHSVAVGLLDGNAGVEQFAVGRVRADDVIRLRRLVEVETTPECPVDEAELVIELADGSNIREEVRGSALTRDEIKDKVRQLAVPRLGEAGVTALLSSLDDLARVPNVSSLLDTACRR